VLEQIVAYPICRSVGRSIRLWLPYWRQWWCTVQVKLLRFGDGKAAAQLPQHHVVTAVVQQQFDVRLPRSPVVQTGGGASQERRLDAW